MVGGLTFLVPPTAGGPKRVVGQSEAMPLGKMKTCLLPGVALCLLLGPLAGEWPEAAGAEWGPAQGSPA